MLNKLSRFSPFFLIAFWSLLLLANFVQLIPQPSTIIGYLWKVEFALAGLIFLTLLTALKFSEENFKLARLPARELYGIVLPIVLFVSWSGLSIFWAESWRNALHHTLLWMCYALFYILARQVVTRPELIDVSLKIAALVISIIGIACIVEYLNTYQDVSQLFTFRYYKYAEAAAMLLPLYLAATLRSKKRTALLAGSVTIIAWFIILLSFSRTELIAGVFSIALFFILVAAFQDCKKYRNRMIILFFALLVPALITQTSILKTKSVSTISRFTSGEDNQKNLQWRYMVWGISVEAFKKHPLQGIGADNFVIDYRNALEDYAQANPENSLLEIDQQIVAERSHNEFIQILAELGIVGILIISWLLLGIGTFLFSLRRKKISLMSLASLAGIGAFFVSSLASSYSFRVPANGICFFFLLAIAAHGFFRKEISAVAPGRKTSFDFLRLKIVFISFGLTVAVVSLMFSTLRGISLMYLQNALGSSDKVAAEKSYQKALFLDGTEPSFRYYYGIYLYGNSRVAEASPNIRLGIDNGFCTSINYFDLAATHIVAGQTFEAEKTYSEALRVFPRSTFLHTAYSAFLKQNGKDSESEKEFHKALEINQRQAESWQIAHTKGVESLTKAGIYNKNLLPAMSLVPGDGVYALIDFQSRIDPSLVRSKF